MHKIQVDKEFIIMKDIEILPNHPILDINGNQMTNTIINEDGEQVEEVMLNTLEYSIVLQIEKSKEEQQAEINAFLEEERQKIQEKIDKYKQAQEYQLQKGGPGPTAEFNVMKIVHEHNDEFELEFIGKFI